MKPTFDFYTGGSRRAAKVKQLCAAKGFGYYAESRPTPTTSFSRFQLPEAQKWRNVAHSRDEGGDDAWFFDYISEPWFGYGFEELLRLDDLRHFIGGIHSADHSWPKLTITDDPYFGASVRKSLLRETGDPLFDRRFKVECEHDSFASDLLTPEVRSLLMRLPKRSVVQVADANVLFLVYADERTPFSLQPIMTEFDRKVPNITDWWSSTGG